MNEFVKKMIIAKQCIKPIILESKETKQSGIYLFERTDEDGITYFYCGQAVNIYNRVVNHWNGYTQRIDISLRKRKFYSVMNPHGWKFEILEYCSESELNERENYFIMQNLNIGKQAYNRTYGSQAKGKVSNIETIRKGYRQGLSNGYSKAQKEIAKLFDKNLVAEINGTTNKLKEKAMTKFIEFIGGETNE